jgi:uncharacterized membrane protein YdbT with pleckstrin-like domain
MDDAGGAIPDGGSPHDSGEESAASKSPFKPDKSSDAELEVEEDLWTGRTHWKHFATLIGGGVSLGLVVIAVLAWRFSWTGFYWGVLVGLLLAVGVAFKIGWTVFSTRYRLTSQRLFVERGILNQSIDQTELIRVDDVRVTKSVMDRLFGLGTIEILSTDFTDRSIVIEGVDGPETVAELVRSRMRTARHRQSVFVESL